MPDTSHDVTVYWRPGCPFSMRLLAGLDEAGLEYAMRNIWEDEEAAVFVRSVANGNETVPTVTIGGTTHVNPPASVVLDAATG